jgi:hypothetical protein
MKFKQLGTKPVSDPVERSLFDVGELLPIKGVWFKVTEVNPTSLVLEPRSFTKGMRDKIDAGRVVQHKELPATAE